MKKFTVNLALRIKLGFILLPLFLIAVVSLYSALNLVGNENRQKKSAAISTSTAVIEKIDRNFYERFGDVQAFAANILALGTAQHQDSLANQTQKFINTMVTYYVLYDLMMIVDSEGKIVACNTIDKTGKTVNTAFLLGQNIADSDWFKSCVSAAGPEGGAWYSDLLANPSVARIYGSRGLGMAFATPIKDESGQLKGAWYNFASWQEVTQGIRQEALKAAQQSEAQAEIILTNQQGMLIDASDENLILNAHFAAQNPANQPASLVTSTQTFNTENYISETVGSKGAYTFKGKNWNCITFIPKSRLSWAAFFTGQLLFISLFILAASMFLSRMFTRIIVNRLLLLQGSIQRMSTGNLSNQKAQLKGRDELTDVESSILQLADGLRQTSCFAEEVGQGKFDTSFSPLSEHDTLGNALLKMRNNLKATAEEDRKRNWATEGLAKFADILRTNHGLKLLAESAIKQLVNYLGANQGGLFVLNDSESHDVRLELVACYAFERKKFLEKSVQIGEGLLGQAYLERASIYLTEVPDRYVRIISGLGDGRPNCLLIVPLQVNNTVEGVIELALFRKLEQYEINFVEKLAESIASALARVKINERTRLLLEESQEKAEQMRAQEEEMRQNMEELSATQEEMHRKESGYLSMIEQLKSQVKADTVD